MKKICFPALVLLMLLCGCSSIPEESFTLATYNIRCPVDKTPHTWKERKPRCLAVIEKNKFDIFGVQEAVRFQLDDLLGTEYQFIGGGRNDFKNAGEFEIMENCLSANRHMGLFRDKKTGKEFVYYNTHLDHVSELARVNGIKLLVRHARENAAGKPLVISGDFNAKPDSTTYKTAKSLLHNTAEVTQTPHKGPQKTFNGYGRSKHTVPIDYIFVSDKFLVLAHKTDDTIYPEGYPSDHFPVITKLLIK